MRILFICIALTLLGCEPGYRQAVRDIVLEPAPQFNADSAYAHIKAQVGFGPRIPGTEAHAHCGDYLADRLRTYGAEVIEQRDSVTLADGLRLPVRNIIASFSSEKKDRVLLFAHWDSRAVADMDPEHPDEPFDSANDGASGVGVLLEVARVVGQQMPGVGVDIILFDTEDQGRAWRDGDGPDSELYYSMGSRFWTGNPHVEGYSARYGIMLDMVGASDARFTLEQHSIGSAGEQMRHIWAIAHRLGHGEMFPFNLTRAVNHDHYYISALTGIPTLTIMHHDNSSNTGFSHFWHTHGDNLDVIDRKTLGAVGQTVVQTLYSAQP